MIALCMIAEAVCENAQSKTETVQQTSRIAKKPRSNI